MNKDFVLIYQAIEAVIAKKVETVNTDVLQ